MGVAEWQAGASARLSAVRENDSSQSSGRGGDGELQSMQRGAARRGWGVQRVGVARPGFIPLSPPGA